MGLRQKINNLAEKYLGNWATEEIHLPKPSPRAALLTGLAAIVLLTAAPRKANAALLHTNPSAYTIFEDDFADRNYDGWIGNASGLSAASAYLTVTESAPSVYIDNLNLPDIFELQFKFRTCDWPRLPEKISIMLQYSSPQFHNSFSIEPRHILTGSDTVTLQGAYTQDYTGNILNGIEWNSISIVKTLNTLEAYENNQLIGSVPNNYLGAGGTIYLDIVHTLDSDFRIDDVKIWTVPEPATMGLLGLGGLFLLNRKKDRKYVESKVVD